MLKNHIYAAIDLKSFYASVECIERGLNPLKNNLVVADNSRTDKTICLAVSPALKAYGIPGRPRLFEVINKIKQINIERQRLNKNRDFIAKSINSAELNNNNQLKLDYIVATPRMSLYIEYSKRIYEIYLKHVSFEDIHVYSIDEVFLDITPYLKKEKLKPYDFVRKILLDVFQETGITATAGIGTNLYLAKVAMDILAKHISPDKNGTRIAGLDEMMYRKKLWSHQPLTDFWHIGKGYERRLTKLKLFTMGDIARQSIIDEDVLYNEFGINAELLIDHAWGYEPCTISDIKAYKPMKNSISTGQVLHRGYKYEQAKIVLCEMIDSLSLDLVEKQLVTKQVVLHISYDRENMSSSDYKGKTKKDNYGRMVPMHSHGTVNLDFHTSSTDILRNNVSELFDSIVKKNLLIRKLNITFCNVINFLDISQHTKKTYEQLDLFTDYESKDKQEKVLQEKLKKEMALQKAILKIKNKYGKNAVLKVMDLQDGATAKERNEQIGGHKA